MNRNVLSPNRIHVLGASGSGTTTLGKALAARMGALHLDTDDFYWAPTDPPYSVARPPAERAAHLRQAIDGVERWTLSGSMMGWGDPFLADLDLVVFLYASPALRVARVLERERSRFDADIEPGGRMHTQHLAFMAFVRDYDREDYPGRSLRRHREWLATLPCPVVELDGDLAVARNVAAVLG